MDSIPGPQAEWRVLGGSFGPDYERLNVSLLISAMRTWALLFESVNDKKESAFRLYLMIEAKMDTQIEVLSVPPVLVESKV